MYATNFTVDQTLLSQKKTLAQIFEKCIVSTEASEQPDVQNLLKILTFHP